MHVLFLTHYFPPEVGAPQTRLFELGRRLVQRGHEVTVLTGLPHYPSGVVPPAYRGRILQREEIDGIRVVRAWVYARANEGFVGRLLDHLSLAITSVPASLTVGSTDVAFVESPPLFLGLGGYFMSRLKRIPFILNVADLWPDAAIALGALRNPAAIGAAKRLERFVYDHSAMVTVVTRGVGQVLEDTGVPKGKIVLLTNGVDLQRFHPDVDPGPAIQRFDLDDRIAVAYAGTHGLAHGLETVIEAAHLLRARTDIRFLMVGEGAAKTSLMELAAHHRLDNVDFFPNQPSSFMPHLWSAVDIALVPLRKLDLFRHTLPAKLFEIMAMERPIILSAEGEARDLVLAAKAGVAVGPENPPLLAAAILDLADDAGARQRFGRNGRRHVQANFDREHLADILEAVLDEVRSEATGRP